MISLSEKIGQEVSIPVGLAQVRADLAVPEEPRGVVLFIHGSGSSRHSPRNRFIAEELHQAHLATLLFDLLTHEEQELDLQTGELRNDIPLLARRVLRATEWAAEQEKTRGLSVGYFGASTGLAGALLAASQAPEAVAAVVGRGGRPDLAGSDVLRHVVTPTLLVVGELDPQVLALNRWAMEHLRCVRELEVVAGATHLFEEPGTLARVAQRATGWFTRYCPTARMAR